MASDKLDGLAVNAFGLTRQFGDLTAVDHIEMRISYGEIFGLLGANGAGKSTMIKMLTTLLSPLQVRPKSAGTTLSSRRQRSGGVSAMCHSSSPPTGH